MKYIFKHCHYCLSFIFPKIYFKTTFHSCYNVQFTDSCKYDIGEDQSDVNKLFGFGYGLHHIDSDRFGWRYNIEKNQIEIVEYCYECGKRLSTKHIAWTNIGDRLNMSIYVSIDKNNKIRNTEYCIRIGNSEIRYNKNYSMKNKWWIFYSLGLYFGGNKRAPHTIKIIME